MGKIKKPKMSQYAKFKLKLERDSFPKEQIEYAASVLAILEANDGGPIHEDVLMESVEDFSVDIGIWEAVANGWLSVAGCKKGEVLYKITKEGRKLVKNNFGRKP